MMCKESLNIDYIDINWAEIGWKIYFYTFSQFQTEAELRDFIKGLVIIIR